MILILEDDESVGKALKETFERSGYHVFLCARPDEAFPVISQEKIEFLFCDCLLPQMTGVEFVLRVREQNPSANFKTILMSGIYTDTSFIQEATEKTRAIAFFKKPFAMDEVLQLLKSSEAPKKEDISSRRLLYDMFSNPNVTNRQKRKVIESLEEISGFDLPFVYSLLVETKSSGYLNIYHSGGHVSGITFSNGNIVGVDIEDKTTYLGEMLIQSGYALPADVQMALQDKSNRRIGNYLIKENKLSPHAFDIILSEQMSIRISRTITEEKIRINFASNDVEMSSPYIDSEALQLFLQDWIVSKVNLSWLKRLYMMWAGYVIVPGPNFSKENIIFESALLKTLEALSQKIEKRMTLSQMLSLPGYNEKSVYKSLHFLLTRGLIVFEKKSSFSSEEEQLLAIKKIHSDMNDMNPYQILAYMEACTLGSGDVKVILNEFKSLLGDEPQNAQSEVHKTWKKIMDKVLHAVDSVNNQQRDEFKQAAARSDAEAKLKATRLLEDVKQALQMNQFAKAADLLAEIAKLRVQPAQWHICNAWAKLGTLDPQRKQHQLKEIEMELMQTPPDERYDALFPLVNGLYSKAKGDINAAKKSFEKSAAMDPSLIVARRELSLVAAQNKKQDILTMDLRDVVSGFFKRGK